jgi:hypothetical protein
MNANLNTVQIKLKHDHELINGERKRKSANL